MEEIGEESLLQLDGPGGTFRVAIGDPDHHSGIWQVKARRNRSTVVIMCQGMGRDAKITLHDEWDWWFAFHDEDRSAAVRGVHEREVFRWKPPQPDAAGWVRAVDIWVPHGELNALYDENIGARAITWLDEAPEGQRVGIHIILATPTGGVKVATSGARIGGFKLADGRALLVYTSVHELDAETRARVTKGRNENPPMRSEAGTVIPTRFTFGDRPGDGERPVMWDLAGPSDHPFGALPGAE
jgi:hypothetical protein